MSESAIAFGRPLPEVAGFGDSEFLAAVCWKRRADRDLARAAGRGDVREFTQHMQRFFRTAARRAARSLLPDRSGERDRFESNGRSAAADSTAESRQALDWLWRCGTGGKRGRLFAAWRSALVAGIDFAGCGESRVGCAHHNAVEGVGTADDDVLGVVGTGEVDASGVVGTAHRTKEPGVAALVRCGELPWALGLVFGDVSGSGRLRKAGRRRLEAELRDGTDADGMPQSALLRDLPEWFAALVRAAEWGEAFDKALWSGETRKRFEKLARNVAALCDRRGLRCVSGASNQKPDDLIVAGALEAATRIVGWKKRRPAARLVRALANGAAVGRVGTRTANRPQRDGGKYPSSQSDDSRLACLRTDWSIDADVLVLAHTRAAPEMRLSMFGMPLLHGAWSIEVAIDGQPLALADSWNCVCWSSDGDGDYIELQQRLPGGIRIERQAMLAREDRLLVLADAVSGAGEAAIEYTARLPLVEGVETASDRQTRECRLRYGRLAARVFPLALADDRILSTRGSFGPVDGGLELKQTARGGLYAPVVLDWHPDRKQGYADWRTLTVGEEGRRVAQSEAWGHRLRIADLQLLVYRSLTETRPHRTILGQHTANETLVGRFDADGEVEAYVLVE